MYTAASERALSGGAVYFTGTADDDKRRAADRAVSRSVSPVGQSVLPPVTGASTLTGCFVRFTDAEKWSSRPSTPAERSGGSLFETNYSTSGCDGPNVRPSIRRPPARRQAVVLRSRSVDRWRRVRSR